MGSRLFLLLGSSTPAPGSINPKPFHRSKLGIYSSSISCSSIFLGSSSDTNSSRISGTAARDGYDSGFGFRSSSRVNRRRNWWSEEPSGFDDYDEDCDDDDDEDDWFGLAGEPSVTDLIFKVLGAFGWMVPAVIISMLLGNGTNTLFMALALPLGQTAVSLVVDKIWGTSGYSPELNRRSKRRPFARSSYETKPGRKTAEEDGQGAYGRRGYQSRTAPNGIGKNKDSEKSMNFGGWDELDKQRGSGSHNIPWGKALNQNEDEGSKPVEIVKLSRRRNREKPLIYRLLISVFPFMGSWTRFFL